MQIRIVLKLLQPMHYDSAYYVVKFPQMSVLTQLDCRCSFAMNIQIEINRV